MPRRNKYLRRAIKEIRFGLKLSMKAVFVRRSGRRSRVSSLALQPHYLPNKKATALAVAFEYQEVK